MNGQKRPSLRVISSSGRLRSSVGSSLALSLDTIVTDGQQLALPGVIPSCTVVSASPAALFIRGLADVLRELHVHHVVDTRLAVEFGSLGLSRREFDAIVRKLGITYRRYDELANQHRDLTWTPSAMSAGFRKWLQGEPARSALTRLRDLIDDGPVVLLSESPYHEGSERQILIAELQEIRPGFACHHVDPAQQ